MREQRGAIGELYKSFKIEIVSHDTQRYDTVGDWYYDDIWHIKVSDTGNWRSNALIAIHELVELILCIDAGIGQVEVDNFDMNATDPEPGDSTDAPYWREHCFAMAVERMVCAAMNMNWNEHERNMVCAAMNMNWNEHERNIDSV